MKKKIKIVLIFIGIIIGIIILDTLQALIFNNNPILGIETKCMKKEGILIDTYHCGNGKNITKLKKFDSSCNYESVCAQKTSQNLEEEIKENIKKILEINEGISSNAYDYIKNDYYKNIINLGPNAIPILVNMYEKESGLEAYIGAIAIEEISNCDIREKYGIRWSSPIEFFKYWKDYNCEPNSGINKDVTLTVKENTVTSKGATFILKNNSDKEYWYGPQYTIERKENDKWIEIMLDEPLSWNAIDYKLKANEETILNIDWFHNYGELEKGEYRLIKTTFREDDTEPTAPTKMYLYATFIIK